VVCRQVFEHRFFHADPHPGNIVLTRRNHIAFLDYGMVGHLAQRDVEAMADLLRAVMEQDPEVCVRVLQLFTTAGYAEDPRALQHEVADLLAFEARAIVDEGRVGAAIEALTKLLRRHRLELAPRFTLLLKALATIESTARSLDPNLEIVPILRPYVEELVLARYRPANLAARAEEELLHAVRIMRTVPDDLQAITGLVRQGRLHFTLHHERLLELGQTLDQAASRLSFSIVMAALILGSSWLLATNVVAQKIGVAGYVGAAVLGVWLAISAMRRSGSG
jgi:ubiquinone biosynthesis protein